MEVVRTLLKQKNNFQFLPINAMSLTNPNSVYSIICEKITTKKLAPASAALFLDEFFKRKDKERILKNHISKPGKGE